MRETLGRARGGRCRRRRRRAGFLPSGGSREGRGAIKGRRERKVTAGRQEGGGGPARRGGDDVARSGPSDRVPLPRGRSGWRFGPRAVSRAPSAINGGSFFWEWQRILLLEEKMGDGVGHVALLE
jgi:hypothetical protein